MKLLLLSVFLFIGIAITLSCNNFMQREFEFFYYPSRNVYYDVTNQNYFYSLDGGKTWDSLWVSEGKEPAIPGAKETLYSATHEIWVDNPSHIQQYKAQTIDIAGYDSTLSKQGSVAERKAKKITVANEDKEPEKKQGFFKRLFGKKNK